MCVSHDVTRLLICFPACPAAFLPACLPACVSLPPLRVQPGPGLVHLHHHDEAEAQPVLNRHGSQADRGEANGMNHGMQCIGLLVMLRSTRQAARTQAKWGDSG